MMKCRICQHVYGFWRQYLNPNLYVIYQDLLEGTTVFARYLLGAEPDGLNAAAKSWDRSSLSFGYGLGQTYWDYYSEGAKGAERAVAEKNSLIKAESVLIIPLSR